MWSHLLKSFSTQVALMKPETGSNCWTSGHFKKGRINKWKERLSWTNKWFISAQLLVFSPSRNTETCSLRIFTLSVNFRGRSPNMLCADWQVSHCNFSGMRGDVIYFHTFFLISGEQHLRNYTITGCLMKDVRSWNRQIKAMDSSGSLLLFDCSFLIKYRCISLSHQVSSRHNLLASIKASLESRSFSPPRLWKWACAQQGRMFRK